ncbi:hypothetical protein BDZ91DRAFT_763087 [Kalaharituber pfeilii]|nr:hypothetical protein BDZ91DRAFT_763087 [Kalaharituber pfeilii]
MSVDWIPSLVTNLERPHTLQFLKPSFFQSRRNGLIVELASFKSLFPSPPSPDIPRRKQWYRSGPKSTDKYKYAWKGAIEDICRCGKHKEDWRCEEGARKDIEERERWVGGDFDALSNFAVYNYGSETTAISNADMHTVWGISGVLNVRQVHGLELLHAHFTKLRIHVREEKYILHWCRITVNFLVVAGELKLS